MSTTIKLVVIGDGAVGKTCLLISYAKKEFPKDYIPTVFDNYVVNITAGEQNIELGLWDTAGQEEYDRLRPLSYANANVFLLCFSVMNPTSYANVIDKWYPELMHFCPDIPFILVGTKSDMRNDQNELKKLTADKKAPVSVEEGNRLATKLGAIKFLDCSAKTQENLKEVFDEAVRCVLRPQKKKKPCILV